MVTICGVFSLIILEEHGIQCMPCSSQILSELIILEEHGIHCMPCSSQILSEMLPEIDKIEMFDLLKFIIHF